MLSTGISILGINTPFLLHMSYWSSGLKWANNSRGHDKFIWACERWSTFVAFITGRIITDSQSFLFRKFAKDPYPHIHAIILFKTT